MSGTIKVVVRCRPLNSREKARGDACIIKMTNGKTTTIEPPEAVPGAAQGRAHDKKAMSFSFDQSYWSACSPSEPDYASQATLYDDLGVGLLDNSFKGYNACIFAYGQTGSGKSFTMMGYGEEKGLIPLTCSELFRRAEEIASNDAKYGFTVEVSYIEIYNEKVKDLLNPKNKSNLKVREHPSLGPYVEDLSRLVVRNYEDMLLLMDEGNKARTVAATQMNETSSRSHSVFTLILTQKTYDPAAQLDAEKVSRISLVDLAGSERANSTGATGTRLKEGANINKSLTTLGKVIAALAAASADPKKKKNKGAEEHVPYRDSVLTWLLKDSLGGNSQTAMIAALSPSSASYDETLSTLRYADQAKKIVTKAVINEDPNARMIRELKEELEMLRARSGGSSMTSESSFDPSVPLERQMVTYLSTSGEIKTVSKADLQDQLGASEKLLKSLNETWEEKIAKTEATRKEREAALEELGIEIGGVGISTPKLHPHLINLNEDALMSECHGLFPVIYSIQPGTTVVGNVETVGASIQIRLSGSRIGMRHAVFVNQGGTVTVEALPDGSEGGAGSMSILNGKRLEPGKPQTLRSGYRLILGDYHVFRFNHPEEVRQHREKVRLAASVSAPEMQLIRPDSPAASSTEPDGIIDWSYAQRELALARLNGQDPGLDALRDEDLDKLFDNLQKVRTLRKVARPESSESWGGGLNESGSRHLSSVFTDDASLPPDVNPWNGLAGSSSAIIGTPSSDKMEPTLSQFRTQLEGLSTTSSAASQEDLLLERAHMERSIMVLRANVARLLEAKSKGIEVEGALDEIEVLSGRELRLARLVLKKWRRLRMVGAFGMTETVLSTGHLVKEANVYSTRLGKSVSYDFAVSMGTPSSAMSNLDDFDDDLMGRNDPFLGVRVIDRSLEAVYIWSFERFQSQLGKMKKLVELSANPTYLEHFSSADPFHDPSPRLSFLGNALVSLAPLSHKVSFKTVSPIFCRYTTEAIGSVRITLSLSPETSGLGIASLLSLSRSLTSESEPPDELPRLAVGSRLSFSLTVDNVRGISPLDFKSVHAQISAASFLGDIASDETIISNLVQLGSSAVSELCLRKKFNIVVTPQILHHFESGFATILFYGATKIEFLERLERWDAAREREVAALLAPSPSRIPQSRMRQPDADFMLESHHDLSLTLSILELAPSGSYFPAVSIHSSSSSNSGVFHLRQGVQRRLRLKISTSGRALDWKSVAAVNIGRVRSVEASTGRLVEGGSGPDHFLSLKLLPSTPPKFLPDGTSTLTAESIWDSSVHATTSFSSPLDRISNSTNVLITLQISIEIASCETPARLSLDVPLRILPRSSNGPGLFAGGFFGGSKRLSSNISLFSLKLSNSRVKELWKLDTSDCWVEGEEVLLERRKPRGCSVVQDSLRLLALERKSASVQSTRALLSAAGLDDVPSSSILGYQSAEKILRHATDIWRSYQFSPIVDLARRMSDLHAFSVLSPDAPKLVPSSTLVPQTSVSKKGQLDVLVDPSLNVWVRRLLVLRRPYLHVESLAEKEELFAINLSSAVNVVALSPEVESLMNRPHAFTLFTGSNSFLFAASSRSEAEVWINAMSTI